MLKKIKKFDVLIFLIPFFVYLLTLLIYYPGILSFDSYNQLEQIKTGIYTTGHPIFHTFIELICMKIYNSPVSIAILQIFIFSLIWTIICKYNRKNDNFSLKIFEVIMTLFVSLNPINSIMSITLWKDVLYSYALLLLTFLVEILIDKKFKLNTKNILWFSFVLALLPNLRYNGLSVVLGMIVTLFIILIITDFKSFNFIKLVIFTFIFYMVLGVPSKVLVNYDAVSNSVGSGTLDGKVTQMAGVYLQKGIFSEDEKAFLNKYFDIKELEEKANPYFMDPIFSIKKDQDYLDHNRMELYKLVIDKSLKNIKPFLDFEVRTTSIIYTITPLKGSIGTIINTSLNAENKDPNINHVYRGTLIYNLSNNLIYGINTNPVIRMFLYMPGTYLWIGIVLTIIMSIKNKRYLLLILPNLFNVGGLALTMPVQDVRYVYANILVGLFIILIYGINKRLSLNEQVTDMKTNSIKKSKVLLIIPAYNEEESIKNTVDTIIKYNKKNKTNYDYIVINDGSKDSTEQILLDNGYNHIRLINNLGIGGAVQTGYKYALNNNYDIAIQFDGDGQHDVNYVKDIIKPIEKGEANLVIGSRFVGDESEFKSSHMRRLGINLISFFIKTKTGVKIYDTTSGFRASDREVIKLFASNYPQEYPEPISTVNVIKNGGKVSEVSAKMKAREAGTSSISPCKSVYYMINVILSIILLKKVK